MSKKHSGPKQLDLDFGTYSPEPKGPSAEHDPQHKVQTKALDDELEASVQKTNKMMQSHEEAPNEVAYGEHPPLPDYGPSHGTAMVERHISVLLEQDPIACLAHLHEGLQAIAQEPNLANGQSLRRRLRDVARAWQIPVSGTD